MRPERYARVREVFLAARERAPEERLRYLEEACGRDGDLRAEVAVCAGVRSTGRSPRRRRACWTTTIRAS